MGDAHTMISSLMARTRSSEREKVLIEVLSTAAHAMVIVAGKRKAATSVYALADSLVDGNSNDTSQPH